MAHELLRGINLRKSKISKADAGYVRDTSVENPTGPFICRRCDAFVAPNACKGVGSADEIIYEDGCCDYYNRKGTDYSSGGPKK